MYVIQLVGLVRGKATEHDGKYLVEFDPAPANKRAGEAHMLTSPNIARAKRFPSMASAHEEWLRVDWRAPKRRDGKPNRPLTAFTIRITAAPSAPNEHATV